MSRQQHIHNYEVKIIDSSLFMKDNESVTCVTPLTLVLGVYVFTTLKVLCTVLDLEGPENSITRLD